MKNSVKVYKIYPEDGSGEHVAEFCSEGLASFFLHAVKITDFLAPVDENDALLLVTIDADGCVLMSRRLQPEPDSRKKP